jgi:hypothetical protein
MVAPTRTAAALQSKVQGEDSKALDACHRMDQADRGQGRFGRTGPAQLAGLGYQAVKRLPEQPPQTYRVS